MDQHPDYDLLNERGQLLVGKESRRSEAKDLRAKIRLLGAQDTAADARLDEIASELRGRLQARQAAQSQKEA